MASSQNYFGIFNILYVNIKKNVETAIVYVYYKCRHFDWPKRKLFSGSAPIVVCTSYVNLLS